jgi:hypothetical protein
MKKAIMNSGIYLTFVLSLVVYLPAVAQSNCGCADSEQKYNPHNAKWEQVCKSSELKYNPHETKWEFCLSK